MELAEIDDDIEAFLLESYENLNQIERDIIELEQASANGEALVRIYRALHTLKGNCGFLPFPKLESVAHAGENMLSHLRDRNLALTPHIINTLLLTVDTIRQILSQIKTTSHEGDKDYSGLITTLTQLQEMEQVAISPAPVAPHVNTPTERLGGSDVYLKTELPETSVLSASESSYIRVDVEQLDRLMNLVGELILARNQVMAFSAKFNNTAFATICQRLSLITKQLHEEVMNTRLQPISTIWQKFPRVIRDLALALGKQVQVDMEGVNTELDKSIIEAMKDPLTHLVRNCIAHGIELPEERTARGKSPLGRLFLRAFHESGKVNIEIGDDGRGLDPEQLKQRAQQLGLVSVEQVAKMSPSFAMNLIFLPGFSTTEQVTSLSGRGVGMDIVKSYIEKINGTLEIYSHLGQGTTFKIKIPLTLTIIPALIITIGGDRYAIPQTSIQELVDLQQEQALNSIEILYNVPVYRLRGTLIPLVYLNELLQTHENSPSPTNSETLYIVIVQVDNYRFGLVVDTIEDIQDIVVKPLGKQLKALSLFAGATILGDGRVVLILDIVGLASKACVSAQLQQLSNATAANVQNQEGDRQMVLLFQGPSGTRMGIPLTMTLRLEEISGSAVEKVGNQYVVQIHNRILPLIDLHKIFSDHHQNQFDDRAFATEGQTLQVAIVSPFSELSVGLVVDRILDIVEEPMTIKGVASRPGVLFCAVIQGQITEILDIEAVIRITNPYLLQVSERV